MSSQRKRGYLVVMIIAAVAMLVNGLLFSDSTPVGVSAHPVDGPAVVPQEAPAIAIPELPFPHGVKSFDPRSEIRDLFSPRIRRDQDQLSEEGADNRRANTTRAGTPENLGAQGFAAGHRLSAILLNDGLRIAIVDGHWMRAGQSLDGCRLTQIEGNRAFFECHDAVVSLQAGTTDGFFSD